MNAKSLNILKTVKKAVDYITDSKIFKIFVKILLLLIISTFFMPFLSASCDSFNLEISFSGLDMASGKSISEFSGAESARQGTPAAFILIIPAVALFIINFMRLPVIARAVLYISTAAVNAVIAFGLKFILETELKKRTGQFGGLLDSALKINIKYGFILYIIFNIILLLAGIILLAIFFRKAIHEIKNTDI